MLPEQLDKLNRRSFFFGGGPNKWEDGASNRWDYGGGLLVSNGPSLGDFLDPPLLLDEADAYMTEIDSVLDQMRSIQGDPKKLQPLT